MSTRTLDRGVNVSGPRKDALELNQGEYIGRDPRTLPTATLEALGHSPKSPLRALRERCLDCCAGSADEVRKCISAACPAWPFRLGKNPWRKAKTLSPEARERAANTLRKLRQRG